MNTKEFAEACLNDLYNRFPEQALIQREKAEKIVEDCICTYTDGSLTLPLQQFAFLPPPECHYAFVNGQWEVNWGRGITGVGFNLAKANQSEEEEYDAFFQQGC